MQSLPTVQIIGFLDWLDKKRYFTIPYEHIETIEELLLDDSNEAEALRIVEEYLATQEKLDQTPDGLFKYRTELFLLTLKAEIYTQYEGEHNFWIDYDSLHDLRDLYNRAFHDVECEIDDCSKRQHLPHDFYVKKVPEYINTPASFIHLLRNELNFKTKSTVANYLSQLDSSSAKAVREFLKYFGDCTNISKNLSNVPMSIINEYISRFTRDSYRRNRLTETQMYNMEATLQNAFFKHSSKSKYFANLTNMYNVSTRYADRTAKFKCMFFPDGKEFAELVQKNWAFLNEYSADHLDIFYNTDELQIKGYRQADQLNLSNIRQYCPCIYLWQTTLNDGKPINVSHLSSDELLSLMRLIINDIVQDKTLDNIVEDAKLYVTQSHDTIVLSSELEKKFLDSLLHCCLTLQANSEYNENASEDQRTTYIRDLLSNLLKSPQKLGNLIYQFAVQDQTRRGYSKTSRTAGRLDLYVTVNGLPYTIIEALNLKKMLGVSIDYGYLNEHISRLGNYDLNGLRQNIILVYLKTNDFENAFCRIQTSLSQENKYKINDNPIQNVCDISSPDYAGLKIIRANYSYNDQERNLYIFIVQIQSRN